MRNIKNIFEYKEFNNIKTVHQAVTNPAKKVNQLSTPDDIWIMAEIGKVEDIIG